MARALRETGEGFAISAAFGSVVVPQDTGDATEAMRKADEAMYAQKRGGRATAGRQSSDALLRALSERHPDLGDHFDGVAELAAEVARRVGIDGEELSGLGDAALLHDSAVLAKPQPRSAVRVLAHGIARTGGGSDRRSAKPLDGPTTGRHQRGLCNSHVDEQHAGCAAPMISRRRGLGTFGW